MSRITTAENFHKKYLPEPNSGCWLWTGFINVGGYGKTAYNEAAHRRSWEIHFGPIPNAAVVCHKCDTPCCVNPAHLFIGSQAANMQDMRDKGRSLIGARNRAAKLSDEIVSKILASRDSNEALAERFGVTPKAISKIRKGLAWKHVKRPDGYVYSPKDGYAARRRRGYKIARGKA